MRRLGLSIFTLLFLFGCGSNINLFSTNDFSLELSEGWIVSENTDDMPKNTELVIMKRDIKTAEVMSINIVSETVSDDDFVDNIYFEKTIEMMEKRENYALISDDSFNVGGHQAMIHEFSYNNQEEVIYVLQMYVLDQINKKGYVLTSITKDMDYKAKFSDVTKIMRSFTPNQIVE